MKEVQREQGHKTRRSRLRDMDSLQVLLDPFTTSELAALQESVKAMAKKLVDLNKTKLVQSDPLLMGDRYFELVRQLPYQLSVYADDFLKAVIERAKKVSTKRRPWRTRHILYVVDHVREKTGKPHYLLVARALRGYGTKKVTDRSLQGMVRRRKEQTRKNPRKPSKIS